MICKISLRVELWNWSWGLYRYETHSYEYFHVMKKKRIHLVSYNIYTYIKKNPMTKDEVKFSFLLAYRIPNFTWVRILFSFLFSSFRFFFLVKIINRWSIYVKLWLNIKAPSLHLHEVLFFEAAMYERLLQKCSLSFQLEGYIKRYTKIFPSWSFGTSVRNEDNDESFIDVRISTQFQWRRRSKTRWIPPFRRINCCAWSFRMASWRDFLSISSSTDVPILRGVRLLRLRQLAGTFVMARCVFLLKIQT